MIDSDGYILKEVSSVQRIKIPEGYIRCPECDGTGRTLVAYRDPGPNEYWSCILCLGKGYEKLEVIKKLRPDLYEKTVKNQESDKPC
jgi:hypothetical protein